MGNEEGWRREEEGTENRPDRREKDGRERRNGKEVIKEMKKGEGRKGGI